MWLQREITLRPRPRGFHLVTREVLEALPELDDVQAGLLHLFIRHTSASLLIQENAAGAVQHDLELYFARLAPESRDYEHDDEGPDDMPAHLRTALTHTHLSIPIKDGRMMLGTWQGIFLFEHRRSTPGRQVVLHLVGE